MTAMVPAGRLTARRRRFSRKLPGSGRVESMRLFPNPPERTVAAHVEAVASDGRRAEDGFAKIQLSGNHAFLRRRVHCVEHPFFARDINGGARGDGAAAELS